MPEEEANDIVQKESKDSVTYAPRKKNLIAGIDNDHLLIALGLGSTALATVAAAPAIIGFLDRIFNGMTNQPNGHAPPPQPQARPVNVQQQPQPQQRQVIDYPSHQNVVIPSVSTEGGEVSEAQGKEYNTFNAVNPDRFNQAKKPPRQFTNVPGSNISV